ncbi:mechanosensitive ion channel family protein [Aquihabitans sp. McL0605]|uniref:mechanosensitive ion channel family protein n=1 Tax=Aquihabitans sp. McL0605 TaxID=3415671 RepID=UPI003CFA0A42
MAPPLTTLLGAEDPVQLAKACSAQPGNACQFVFEHTHNQALAKFVDWITDVPLQILWILLVAWIVNQLVGRAIRRFGERIQGMHESETKHKHRFFTKEHPPFVDTGEVNMRSAARAMTITGVLRSVASGVIGVFAVIYILGVLGWDLGPLIAGAGLVGIALGFGAQSLVRDFLSGFFMLIEDHFGVGDVVDLGEASGTVEQVTLRVTRLRDQNGTVWHVPNGEVRRVGNKSQQWARAVLDVAVSPQADLERAAQVIGDAAAAVWELREAAPDVLGEPEVLGIEYLGPDAATIRVQGKTRPGAQWRVSRLLRVRIAEALAEAGIDLPPSTFVRQNVPPR